MRFSQNQKIQFVMDMTGCDFIHAKEYLTRNNWITMDAVDAYRKDKAEQLPKEM